MKSAFFISDVHLTEQASPSGEALLFLIRKAQKEAELFVVLGDLFDLWVGRASVLQKAYSNIIEEFRKLKQSCRLIYLEGNHDFHLKNFWQSELGFEVYEGPIDIVFGNLKLRLEHGDESNRNDRGYLFLRWFLRTFPIKTLAQWTPSRVVVEIGKRASDRSRLYTTTLRDKLRGEKIKTIGRNHAEKLRKVIDFDVLITGHTHVADDHILKQSKSTFRLINLGSWFDGPHFLRIDSEGRISNQQIHSNSHS